LRIRNLLIIIGLYLFALIFSFVSEYTYKKKSITEIKENAKEIIFKITILFAIMIIASFVYAKLGIKAE
jgi:hypothetical protein